MVALGYILTSEDSELESTSKEEQKTWAKEMREKKNLERCMSRLCEQKDKIVGISGLTYLNYSQVSMILFTMVQVEVLKFSAFL